MIIFEGEPRLRKENIALCRSLHHDCLLRHAYCWASAVYEYARGGLQNVALHDFRTGSEKVVIIANALFSKRDNLPARTMSSVG